MDTLHTSLVYNNFNILNNRGCYIMSTTAITKLGLRQAALAGMYGPQITITGVKIGSNLITASSDMTDVSGKVWEGGTDYIRYQVLNDSTVLFKITLTEDIGDFNIGNIGLYLDSGDLFAIVALPAVSEKIKNNPPDVVGNRRIFNIPIVLSGIATITNLSVLIADEASIPVVANETYLPEPLVAPYSVYSVLQHTGFGAPVLAIRVDSNWWFVPAQLSVGSGYQFSSANFDTQDPPAVGDAIRFDKAAGLFRKADATNLTDGYMGFRGPNNTVVIDGRYRDPNSTEENPSFVAGLKYYADGGVQAGRLTVTPTAWYVGMAVDGDTLLLNVQDLNPATTSYPGYIQLATVDEVEAGSNNTKAVTPFAVARGASSTKANELSNGQFYNVSTSSIPSWTLYTAGESKFGYNLVPHQIGEWVEGPKNFLRLVHSIVDLNTSYTSGMFQDIPNASKYQNTTKTISFRARGSANGQRILVGAEVSFGTGGVPSSILKLTQTWINLSTDWNEYSVTFVIPTLVGVYTFGTNNDDFLRFSIGMQPNTKQYFDLDWYKVETGSFGTGIRASTPEYCLQNADQYIFGNWVFENVTLNGARVGTLNTGSANLTGATTIADTLTVNARTTFTNTVTFNNQVTLNGNVRVTGTLTCDKVIEGIARKAYYADAN